MSPPSSPQLLTLLSEIGDAYGATAEDIGGVLREAFGPPDPSKVRAAPGAAGQETRDGPGELKGETEQKATDGQTLADVLNGGTHD